MRRYGTSLPVDLVLQNSGGQKSVAVTPGAAIQSVNFQLPTSARLNPNGHFACTPGTWVELTTTFDQASSGGSVVNADDLPRFMKSFQELNPDVWGMVKDPNVWTGPIAKNIIERICNGYRNAGWDRAQISASDGDTVVTLLFFLPDVHENAEDGPEQFCRWIGWSRNTVYTFSLDVSTAIAAVSTGAVIKTAATFRAWQNTYAFRRPPNPVMSIWKRYLSPAVGAGNVVTLRNFGAGGGFTHGSTQVRIAFLAEVMNVLGLGGISTADTITSFLCDLFNQSKVDNVQSLTTEFRRLFGHLASSTTHDGAGFPHTMAATPNATMQASTLMFMVLRYMSAQQRTQNLMRWPAPADLEYQRDQASGGPSSGNHLVLACDLHETNAAGETILRRMGGAALMSAKLVPMNPRHQQLTPNQRFASGRVFWPAGT